MEEIINEMILLLIKKLMGQVMCLMMSFSDIDDKEDNIACDASQSDISCEILLLLATARIKVKTHVDFGDPVADDDDNGLEGHL